MEDALVHMKNNNVVENKKVLILVLMEDALVLNQCVVLQGHEDCLNPCFNGRCTRTAEDGVEKNMHKVLILVLMEDALVRVLKWATFLIY